MIQTNLLNQQNSGNGNSGGMANPNMMGMQNMQQNMPNNQGIGMQNMQQGGNIGNAGIAGNNMMGPGMFQNQAAPYQNTNQNYSNYGNQGIVQQGGQGMMGNFNQMGQQQRNTQAEYIAQQRALAARNNQYGQHAPNVTMNNIINQGAVPPYPRQGGKPAAAAQNQQQFQQQRLRQQMLMQQQQGMGQQANTQGMVQNQGQGINPQQTPNLVAQLQRQIPNQANMMNQQYSHQPPPY